VSDCHHNDVGSDAIRDEHLRAVHHEAAVRPSGVGPHRRYVRADVGLGDAERRDPFTGDTGNEIALHLVLGAELRDRWKRD